MKALLAAAAFIAVAPAAALAQDASAEREVRAFLTDYDRAVASRDIAFLERVLPEDYVYTGASGRKSDRTRVLTFFRDQRAAPTETINSLRHDNVMVRVVGDMAVVTNDYTAQTTPIGSPDAEPHTDTGRHTKVMERRDGRWMVIAEQDTEQPHDDELMQRQVLRAGREYRALIQQLASGRSRADLDRAGEIAALDRLLVDEYTRAGRDGEVSGKAAELARYGTGRIRLRSAELLEQEVRVVDNGTAVETGKVRYVGTDAGRPLDITERYTATWVFWGERWRIVAEHASAAGSKD